MRGDQRQQFDRCFEAAFPSPFGRPAMASIFSQAAHLPDASDFWNSSLASGCGYASTSESPA